MIRLKLKVWLTHKTQVGCSHNQLNDIPWVSVIQMLSRSTGHILWDFHMLVGTENIAPCENWFTYYVSDVPYLCSWMTNCLGKSCSFGLPCVPFVNCCQCRYSVISLMVLRAGCRIRLYQFLIIAYLFTFHPVNHFFSSNDYIITFHTFFLSAKFQCKFNI